jgi:peptide/nickel transport system substrate-binding protein
MIRAVWFAVLCLSFAGPTPRAFAADASNTLRFGIEFDPDVLDPARDGSYTGRVVFAAMCDQLLDVNDTLDFVPQLATAWEWTPDNLSLTLHLRPNVVFQDGLPLDAAAVQANFKRNIESPESLRKSELKPVIGVDAIDPLTVRIRLSAPYAPLLSLLANRPGMMLSPAILGLGTNAIATHPVCAGPYRFTERVAQDHITLDRFPGYWNAAAIAPDRVVFQPIPDPSVRLINLRSGALDIVNRAAPSDADTVRRDARLRLVTSPSIGFQILTVNVNHMPGATTPMAKDPRVREAFEKSLDRAVINQVAMDGQFTPSNQTEPPGTRYWDPAYPVPPRDLEGAKALLRAAGTERVAFTLLLGNDPINRQIGELIQSMSAEAGFDVTLQPVESAAAIALDRSGNFQMTMGIWSGRPDPDQNISIWAACDGFLNFGDYCDIVQRDRSHIVLFHFKWLWAMSERVQGFVPMPDGITRFTGLHLKH